MRIGRIVVVLSIAVGSLVAAGLSQGKSVSPAQQRATKVTSYNTTPAQDAKGRPVDSRSASRAREGCS